MNSGLRTLLFCLIIGILQLNFAQIEHYNPAPYKYPNKVGTYRKLKNVKPWDGQKPGVYSIKVKVRGLKTGDTIWLVDNYLDGKYMRDTAIVKKNGVAEFNDTFALQRGFYLVVMPKKNSYFDIVIDDDQDFYVETDTAFYSGDYYSKMVITGSESNIAYRDYEKKLKSFSEERYKIEKSLEGLTDTIKINEIKDQKKNLFERKRQFDLDFVKAHPAHIMSKYIYSAEEPEIPKEYANLPKDIKDSMEYVYYKTHYWDNIDLKDNAYTRMPTNVLKQKFNYYFDKLITPDADSIIVEIDQLVKKSEGAWENEKFFMQNALSKYSNSQYMGHDKILVFLGLNYYANGRIWWLDSASVSYTTGRAYEMSTSVLGAKGNPVQLRDTSGNFVSTENLPAKYTFMVFWDPTCGHCREVVPKLGNIYQKHKSEGWVVVALSTHDHEKEWKQFIREHPETKGWIHLRRGEVTSDEWAYNVKSYFVYASPTIFILDAQRKIIANKIDVEKIEEFLKAWEKREIELQKRAKANN